MSIQPTFVVKSEEDILCAFGIGPSARFSGDERKISLAKAAADQGVSVSFLPGVRKLVAGWSTEEGILAALLATAPGRCYIRKVPEDLLEELHELAATRPGEVY